MKNTAKFIVVALFATQAAFACPDWEQNVSYSEGDQITYQGKMYVAARTVAPNTAPTAGDNGWFWIETSVACDDAVTVEADTVKILTHYANPDGAQEITLDSAGIDIYNSFMGGNRKTFLTYGNMSLEQRIYFTSEKTEISPASLKLSSVFYGEPTNTTEITESGLTTDGVVKAGSVVAGGVDLKAKVTQLEARIATLEAALKAK